MSPNSWFSQPAYIPSGDPDTMSVPTLDKPGQLGIRFNILNPPRTPGSESSEDGSPRGYKIVKTDSTMSVAPFDGAVAWFSDQANNVVTTSPTALGRGRVAGVFKSAVVVGHYCCIQQKGKARVKFIDAVVAANVTAAGNFVIPSATAAKADVIAAGTAATYPLLGRSASALNLPDATAIVDLDVPDTL